MRREEIGFWGKIQVKQDGEIEQWLSLTQHSLDVAAVFLALVELPTIRRRLEAACGVTLDHVQIQRLAVIALLHDIGKANLGFQDKVFDAKLPRAGHVRELAPLFDDTALCEAFAVALDLDTIEGWFDTPESMDSFLLASWSHHGLPVRFQGEKTGFFHLAKTRWWRPSAGRDPMRAIAELARVAKQAFPAAFSPSARPIPTTPALQHRFAGLTMLADWLGSHQSFFPLSRPVDEAFDKQPARHALRSIGLDAALAQSELASKPGIFQERFGFPPRPLQQAIDILECQKPTTRLLIAEAETGSGKTEAALARFFNLFAASEVDSLYFALPTRVAARELYGRVVGYLAKVFPDPQNRPLAVLAVPGYARVDNVPIENLLPDDQTRYHDDPSQHRQERQWAAQHPKRFLAATVAVGTIDQALLSAVQTKHAHMRSVCLDRSLLVVDEVHASDAYMRRLLHGLLAHHVKRMQGQAVLLSATLGSAARTEFLQACGVAIAQPPDYASAIVTPYPACTDLRGVPLPVSAQEANEAKGKKVRLEPLPWLKQPENLLPRIAQALRSGARILVVFNTVARAVSFQRDLERHQDIDQAWLFRCGTVICPHHGRFAPTDRELLDKAVSGRWGRDTPAGPLILVGTQTLEQSLDIDADWLITDLCPMDVLLQRIGRLHRHERHRPRGFKEARCTVLVPDFPSLENCLDVKGEAMGEAKKAGLGSVYEDTRILELTRRLLAERPEVEIPRDNRLLVEGATHPDCLESLTGERWAKHQQIVDGCILAKETAAYYAAADYTKPFGECAFNDIDKNPKARTRLGLDTLRIRLAFSVTGPFGISLVEILIPGHLAPKDTSEETAEILHRDGETVELSYGGQAYRYSRYGLEKLDEPAD